MSVELLRRKMKNHLLQKHYMLVTRAVGWRVLLTTKGGVYLGDAKLCKAGAVIAEEALMELLAWIVTRKTARLMISG